MIYISTNNYGHPVSVTDLEMTQKLSDLTIFRMIFLHIFGVTVVNLTHGYHITTLL